MGKMEYAIFGVVIVIIVSFVFGFAYFISESGKTSNISESGNELCQIIEQGSIYDDRIAITYFQCNWTDGSISKCTKTSMGTSCQFSNSRFG